MQLTNHGLLPGMFLTGSFPVGVNKELKKKLNLMKRNQKKPPFYHDMMWIERRISAENLKTKCHM